MDKAVESGRCGSAAAPSPSGSSPQSGLDASHSVTNAQRERSAHTPGPWRIGDSDSEVATADGAIVAAVFATSTSDRSANARLIKEAPALLSECRQMLATLELATDRVTGWNYSVDSIAEGAMPRLRALIAKAEGRHD